MFAAFYLIAAAAFMLHSAEASLQCDVCDPVPHKQVTYCRHSARYDQHLMVVKILQKFQNQEYENYYIGMVKLTLRNETSYARKYVLLATPGECGFEARKGETWLIPGHLDETTKFMRVERCGAINVTSVGRKEKRVLKQIVENEACDCTDLIIPFPSDTQCNQDILRMGECLVPESIDGNNEENCEYRCYMKYGFCNRGDNGSCGWKPSNVFKRCIQNCGCDVAGMFQGYRRS